MSKYALIPVEELNKLEQARKDLHEILEQVDDKSIFSVQYQVIGITGAMWEIANRRWSTLDKLPNNRLVGFGTEDTYEF